MNRLKSFVFPDIPSDLSDLLFQDDRQMVIVGVLGKSKHFHCNKMTGLNVLSYYPSLIETDIKRKDGKITFYFEENSNILYLHFETMFDAQIMQDFIETTLENDNPDDPINIISVNSRARTKFARILLFAIQICHIIVLVETNMVFDSSYLSIFKALKTIREKYVLKFLPKLLKNSNAGTFMGKEGRLCSPRFLFFFEKCLHEFDDKDGLQKLEFDIEDRIYKLLRNEFIITNNSSMSLFSIPRNKRFVYVNIDERIHSDPVTDSIEFLLQTIERASSKEKNDDDLDDIRPFKGFAKPLKLYANDGETKKPDSLKHDFLTLLKDHVVEAIEDGFDDSVAKFKGKSHFVIPSTRVWFETFKMVHKIFVENPENPEFEANDVDYIAFLENFHKTMDVDERFFTECCEYGLDLAVDNYKDIAPHHYSSDMHEQKIFQSTEVLAKYARIGKIETYELKLRKICDDFWHNGRQQCELLSLRGNPCVMPKHDDATIDEHSSGVVYVSTCNCGRTQGRREDPYTIRQGNYDFYQLLATSCTACNKIERINFSVFEPSTNDFKAAEFDKITVSSLGNSSLNSYSPSQQTPPLTTTQSLHESLSISTIDDDDNEDKPTTGYDISDDDSVNEIVIKVAETKIAHDKLIVRQPSTTEYLPGMVHTLSPVGLLPQFPSWSLVCIGPSSVYSHSTGLPEHVQSGFLSGTNFLLPWDVHVRLEHAASWAASYEKSRSRKKPQPRNQAANAGGNVSSDNGQVFILKIFIGCEYECPRGHRFIMNAPDKVVRGGAGIIRDSGSKIVFNDMPLYFPCACRSTGPKIAQLMRIHIVTPKAPVNVILDPKIRPGGKNNYIFTTGLSEPPKLSQSAYWILRLPYIYQGDDGPILPPLEVTSSNAMIHGCLMAGMYGISETSQH